MRIGEALGTDTVPPLPNAANLSRSEPEQAAFAGWRVPSVSEFDRGQTVEADTGFGRLKRQLPMDIWRHAHHELAAEGPACQRFGDRLPILLHVGDRVGDNGANSPERRLRGGCQPAQTRKLRAQTECLSARFFRANRYYASGIYSGSG